MCVSDLAALVCDFSDDSTLLKLSMLSKTFNSMLTNDNHSRWRMKGYNIRLLKHKYKVASVKLQIIKTKIRNGELVDVVELKE